MIFHVEIFDLQIFLAEVLIQEVTGPIRKEFRYIIELVADGHEHLLFIRFVVEPVTEHEIEYRPLYVNRLDINVLEIGQILVRLRLRSTDNSDIAAL
jgi:hypothetical protein